jgi:hypothetical protein
MMYAHLRAAVIAFALASVPAGSGQQSPDPTVVLQRVGQRLLADLDRMPRYTCVQTITRKYYEAASRVQHPTCSTLIAAHQKRKHELDILRWDRMRLEVALVDNTSVYSWVGAPKFDEATLDQLAGHGPLGSGDFGIFLIEILRRATPHFQQEVVLDGRRLLEYSYSMPLEKSRYKIKTSDGWAFTAYGGTILLDPEAADIVRLTVRTAELPAASTGCQVTSEVDYGRKSIHDRMILVPRETRLRSIERAGNETASVTSFTSCREYSSTVRMLWDGPHEDAQPASVRPATPAEQQSRLPAGLHFSWRLVTPIDSDTVAAGDPIEAVLRRPIRNGKNQMVAPAGARLRGRLRWVEQRIAQRSANPDTFVIGVQFESMEIAGKRVPFTATTFSSRPQTSVERSAADDPQDIGNLFFQQEHLRIKQADAEWITTSMDTGKDKK